MNDPQRLPLSRAKIDAEKVPETGARDVWDTDVRGLMVRLTPGGKVFYLSKWAQSAQRWIKIGPYPETSVKDARARALELLAAITRGEKPWEDRKKLAAEATLNDLWEHHKLHAEGRKRESTLKLYAHAWAHLEALHKRKIGSISRNDIQREVNRIGKQRPVMANRVHSLVGVLYQTAINADRWKGANPALGVDRFTEKTRSRFMKPEELKAWWLSLEHEPDAWRIYFVTAVLCGARKSNVSGMRWADVDLDRGIWSVPGEKSKNGEQLVIVMTAPLVAILRDWRGRCPSPAWVFPTVDAESEVPHVQDPKRPWRRVITRASLFRLVAALAAEHQWSAEQEAAARTAAITEADHFRARALGRREKFNGDPLSQVVQAYAEKVSSTGREPKDFLMGDVHVHDLRRTLGSWATITGASLPIVGSALGHRSLSATQVYARLLLDPVRDAVETAGQSIIGHGGDAAARVMTIPQEAQS